MNETENYKRACIDDLIKLQKSGDTEIAHSDADAVEEFTAQDILDYLDANLHHLHKYKDGRIVGKFGGVTAIGDGSVSEFIKTTMLYY